MTYKAVSRPEDMYPYVTSQPVCDDDVVWLSENCRGEYMIGDTVYANYNNGKLKLMRQIRFELKEDVALFLLFSGYT